jgi:hypothetical protein
MYHRQAITSTAYHCNAVTGELREIAWQQKEFAATHGNQGDVIAGMGVCS